MSLTLAVHAKSYSVSKDFIVFTTETVIIHNIFHTTMAQYSVAEWLGCWTCDQQVVGSIPSLSTVECNPGHVNTHMCLCHQAV